MADSHGGGDQVATDCPARVAAMWAALRAVVADPFQKYPGDAVQALAQAIWTWQQAHADLDGTMEAVAGRLGYVVAPEGTPPDYQMIPGTGGLAARRVATGATLDALEAALVDFDCSNADWENAAAGWEDALAGAEAEAAQWNADYEAVRADWEFYRTQT